MPSRLFFRDGILLLAVCQYQINEQDQTVPTALSVAGKKERKRKRGKEREREREKEAGAV